MFKYKYIIAAVLAVIGLGVALVANAFGIDGTLGAAQFGALAVLMLVAPANPMAGFTCDDPLAEIAKKFKESSEETGKKMKDLSGITDEMKARLDRRETLDTEFTKKLDEHIAETKDAQTKTQELAHKLEALSTNVKSIQADTTDPLEKAFKDNTEFKSFADGGARGRFGVEVEGQKAITTVTAAGLMPQPYRDSIVSMERNRFVMRDLLTIIPVTSGSVEYAQQNLRTNAAAPVAEGAAKPYSDYGWTTQTAAIRTLAHLAKLSKQSVEDIPRLLAEIQSEMRYGLSALEETQLLFGNGTGQNINGIMPQAIGFNQAATLAKVKNATAIDVLRMAILQVVLANAPVDGIVLNPTDWALIELTKTTDNAYLFARIQGAIGNQLWNTRIVDTPSMTADNFLVGGFAYGAHMYQRTGVQVDLSTENDKDFENNMMTLRVEERIGLGVLRPYAFSKGVFTTILTP